MDEWREDVMSVETEEKIRGHETGESFPYVTDKALDIQKKKL